MHFINLYRATAGRLLLLFLFVTPFFLDHGSRAVLATGDDPTPLPYPLTPHEQESARPLASQPAKAAEVVLSGWFTIIWGDGEPGSDTAVSRYFLIDDNGQAIQVSLNQALIQSIGGLLSLDRQRVQIEGVWAVPPAVGAATPQQP